MFRPLWLLLASLACLAVAWWAAFYGMAQGEWT